MPWHQNGKAPDSQDQPQGSSRTKTEQHEQQRGTSTAKSAVIFAVAAVATLVAGAALEVSGDAASKQVGLSGILFGATVLALATSLPEISTGLTAVKNGDYQLAISDIFGGNAFLPVLFFVATLISGKAALPQAGKADIYLTAVAMVLTAHLPVRRAVPAAQADPADGRRLAGRAGRLDRQRGRPVRDRRRRGRRLSQAREAIASEMV